MTDDTPPMVNLNVSDISDAVTAIDHASDQGAYRGWSIIRQILPLRDRLEAFVLGAAALTQAGAPAEDEAGAAASGATPPSVEAPPQRLGAEG